MPSLGPSLPLWPQGQRRTPPQSRRLCGWGNTHFIIPSTPRHHLGEEKTMQNQNKTEKHPQKSSLQGLMEAPTEASGGAPGQRAA